MTTIAIIALIIAVAAVAVCFVIMKSVKESNATLIEANRQLREDVERERNAREAEKREHEMHRQQELAALQQELHRSTIELQGTNASQLGLILTPLKEKLENFSKAVNNAYVNETAGRKSLADQVEKLMTLNMSIGEEARNLTNALKGDSKVQGDWGEKLLTKLLENEGLVEGVHFSAQYTRDESGKALRDEEGNLRRPDVVLRLPGERNLIIDSKVSLTAYADYIGANDEKERDQSLKKHLLSMKKHVEELARKEYHKIVNGSAEQVLMYVPIEGAYFLAMENDHNLSAEAMKKKVVIVTSTHLLSVIGLIEQLWRVEKQNVNAAEIARLGGLIYDSIVNFSNSFENISKHLEAAGRAYDNSRKALTESNQSVIARAERMRQLGAKNSKILSSSMLKDLELSSELRSLKVKSEGDPEVPVAGRTGKIVGVEGKGSERKVVNGSYFTEEFSTSEPS